MISTIGQTAQYYFDGFSKIPLSETPFFQGLLNELRKLHYSEISGHEDFSKSYDNTYDLQSQADLNARLVELLFDQGIPEAVSSLTGREYVLGDLVLRKSLAKKSYMPWHRDTYLDRQGRVVGRTPPLVKVIIYPQLEAARSHELSVLRGTSKRVFRSHIIDKLQRVFTKQTKIFQSNQECIMFDSSILHSAIHSGARENGSFRIIYNFCDQSQIDSFKTGAPISELYKRYKAIYV